MAPGSREQRAVRTPALTLEVIERECEPAREVNEDRLGSCAQAAWVIDGATGIRPTQVLPGPSDAAWLAASIDQQLAQGFAADDSGEREAIEILRTASRKVVEAFDRERNPTGEIADGPSASVAVVRARTSTLELVNLGDCRILHAQGKKICAFGSSNVTTFDRKVVAALVRMREEQAISYGAAWPSLKEIIRSNRDWINVPGGYWVFDLSQRWLNHLQVARLPYEPSDVTLLLISDGFYRLVDTFHVYTDSALFAAAQGVGLQALYEELRHIEQSDMECIRYPRIKPSDDASAMLLRLTVLGR